MKKYIANNGYGKRIRAIEIDKETDSSVWVDGRVRRKYTEFESFFDTFEQAKEWLLLESKARLDQSRRQLEREQSIYGNILGLKEQSK